MFGRAEKALWGNRVLHGQVLPALGLMLWLIAGAGLAASPEPLRLIAGPNPIPLGRHVEILRDDSASLTFDDVRTPSVAAQFAPSGNRDVVNQGFGATAYWYRFALRNPESPWGGTREWVLELGWPLLDFVDIYISRGNGNVESLLTGDLRHPPPQQLPHRTFAFPLWIDPGEAVTVHVRVHSEGRHSVPLVLWTRTSFDASAARENLMYGAFFGVLLVMALYNLIVFLWVRNRAYLWYVLYIVTIGIVALSTSGYARQYGNALFAGAPVWINPLFPAAVAAANLCAALFMRAFLEIPRHAPRWDLWNVATIAVFATLLLLNPLLGYNAATQLGLALTVANAGMAVVVSALLSLRGLRAARFYLLAWGVFLVTLFFAALAALGVIPPSSFTINAWQVGVCFDVTLLSFALADRINQERKEKFSAREAANRLRSFLPKKVAEMVGGGDHALLEPKHRQITICVIDLRGFTPFSETSAPEDVMNVLREFFTTMGDIVEKHGGTVEHFAGDSMLIFFNAPLEIPKHEERAVRAAVEMQTTFGSLRGRWAQLGHELGLGIGIADGYATIGTIGFSGRFQYSAIGAVTNLASRLCSDAKHGEILTTGRVLATVESLVRSESVGEQTIRGFSRPVQVIRVLGLQETDRLGVVA